MSRGELADAVEIAAGGLQSLGLRCGDIVASVAYNDERAIVGALRRSPPRRDAVERIARDGRVFHRRAL